MVTPTLEQNYRTITLRTKLRLLAEDVVFQNQSSECHLYRKPENAIAKKRKLVKKIVIVGIHGFLPIKLVKTLIGQSTGNSVKFVAEATRAVQQWLQQNNPDYDPLHYDIQTIALEGEGKIGERAQKLYRLLENWRAILEQSHFLFVVSHSQGTPVAIQLLARLVGEMAPGAKVGLLSMAGFGMGPIAGLDSKLVIRAFTPIEREIIGEMFELQKPGSELSIQLNQAMEVLIHHNVKITFCGAIDDQFVAISSSLANQYQHPNIFRVVYVDKDTQTPEFVVSLVKTIAIMKNMGGFRDYGVLRDIGDRFVGTVGAGSHCKVARDPQVYMMGVQHSLETTSVTRAVRHPLRIHASGGPVLVNDAFAHMYMIPWNVRSLVQELIQINNIRNVQLLRHMVRQYRGWQPVNRAWKDVKYCLSALEELEVDELVL
ncbi:uncharacterized protein CANTADRAFT_53170 [Suhomyces tanzawaensis NRRL Y-17324]|uniref:YMC020W-like alpha/beta hydrolase domain-containing protein n=1 Tax=Suhomyces tanzawaensis NRRL Y-17324 TaxID=984487 RepID=A0A1E4SH13_9ASCO|nr:uncharacterized protein CANTADRAFT_53170 [Suhomyces tanzawaensis NRRL Y-17324]ODV78760.1 hypothetical protein CANTADRAFT_53170 [Suhomyces tanzawaensis NRRL Y-17324]